jgi:N-acetylmuramate 1-kinase
MTQSARPEPELSLLWERAAPQLALPRGNWVSQRLTGDGSDRQFHRVRQGELRFVALISPRKPSAEVDENDSYFHIGMHLLRHRVPVPSIHWADLERGHFLLTDLGDVHLQTHVAKARSPRQLERVYHGVLQLLIGLHARGREGFDAGFCFDHPVYDPAFVFERELEYFRKAFLVAALGLEAADDLGPDFERLAESAGTYDRDFVMHRDFQSRNIMVHRGRPWLIDFQGMRYGPPAYDLASLLLDPYVMLPADFQARLLNLYWSGAAKMLNCNRRQFRARFRAVLLARNLQVLGAYGHLGLVKGKTSFLQYIPGAWMRLWQLLTGPCRGQYPRLEQWVNFIQDSGRVAQSTQQRWSRGFCMRGPTPSPAHVSGGNPGRSRRAWIPA